MKFQKFLSSGVVDVFPDEDLAIVIARCQIPAIRGNGQGNDQLRVSGQAGLLLPGLDVPQLDCPGPLPG